MSHLAPVYADATATEEDESGEEWIDGNINNEKWKTITESDWEDCISVFENVNATVFQNGQRVMVNMTDVSSPMTEATGRNLNREYKF